MNHCRNIDDTMFQQVVLCNCILPIPLQAQQANRKAERE